MAHETQPSSSASVLTDGYRTLVGAGVRVTTGFWQNSCFMLSLGTLLILQCYYVSVSPVILNS